MILCVHKGPTGGSEKDDDGAPNIPKTFVDGVLNWAHKYSTLAFPSEIIVSNQPVTLMDRSQQVQVPVLPRGQTTGNPFSSICQGLLGSCSVK